MKHKDERTSKNQSSLFKCRCEKTSASHFLVKKMILKQHQEKVPHTVDGPHQQGNLLVFCLFTYTPGPVFIKLHKVPF